MSRARLDLDQIQAILDAARDAEPVGGLTHNFYRYPARFSPRFAATAIDCFSRPGDVVLDAYMGGGTAIVEALRMGRKAVGNDLNSLAVFVTKVKTTLLDQREVEAIRRWASDRVPALSYRTPHSEIRQYMEKPKMHNLTLPRARFITKLVASAMEAIQNLPTESSRDFARCVLLRASQWALDGRKQHTALPEFRQRIADDAVLMLAGLAEFTQALRQNGGAATDCKLLNEDASQIDQTSPFVEGDQKAKLVVTSPPYPGVHILYHRWQVDGRKETPAPYWIAGCDDGEGASFYNFGDRREKQHTRYFDSSLRTLRAIRKVVRDDAIVVQMVAFSDPATQLPRYLSTMESAGFSEMQVDGSSDGRIWRDVPNRRWHAVTRGKTTSSREVVLIHRPS